MTHVVSPSLMLACLSRPQEAALVSVLNDDRPYLTPWREETQERRELERKDRGHILQTPPGIVTPSLLRSKCWPVPSRGFSHADLR